jgi:5,10-methylenetetrahydromethanopterin reductase
MQAPAFGLNRFDFGSVERFAKDVRRAEDLGWDYGFIPDSQLRRRDTYVMLSAAARATSHIHIGPLIANPVNRHISVTASSIATIDELANGRTVLGLGIGDTSVRLAGLRPARVHELEEATHLARKLLHGESIQVGARQQTHLPHARPVPIWIAAGGPRMLRAAGRVADGVFIRVGTSYENLDAAIDAVHTGALEAGRDPKSVRLGLVLHTVLIDDPELAVYIGRAMAAGYYEYSPTLFDKLGLSWNGPPIEELQGKVSPDFHHTPDLEGAGRLLEFFHESTANAFCLHGDTTAITEQLIALLSHLPPIEIVVLHPVPDPVHNIEGAPLDYMGLVASEILPRVRIALE